MTNNGHHPDEPRAGDDAPDPAAPLVLPPLRPAPAGVTTEIQRGPDGRPRALVLRPAEEPQP